MKSYANAHGKYHACSQACHEGFEADRSAGAVYGPYMLADEDGKPVRLARNVEEASRWSGDCVYCGESN